MSRWTYNLPLWVLRNHHYIRFGQRWLGLIGIRNRVILVLPAWHLYGICRLLKSASRNVGSELLKNWKLSNQDCLSKSLRHVSPISFNHHHSSPFPTKASPYRGLWTFHDLTPTTNLLIFLHDRGSAVGFQITTHQYHTGWRLHQHKVDNCMMYSSIILKHYVGKGTESSCVFTRHLVHVLQISAMVSTLWDIRCDVLWFIRAINSRLHTVYNRKTSFKK